MSFGFQRMLPEIFSYGNIIEDCIISQYLGGPTGHQADMNAINIISGNGPPISGIIRDNQVFGSPSPILVYGLNAEFNSLIEGNYVQDADTGLYSDSGISTNLVVTHNIFYNVRSGVLLQNVSHQNITFSYNTILLSTNLPFQIAFNISCGTNINVIGNTVGWAGTPTGSGTFLSVADIQGLVIADNRVDSSLSDNLTGESAYNCIIRDNYDLYGNYLSVNIPTVGNTPVTSLGLNLIGSSVPGSVLMDLGLPLNPSGILTNGEAQPVDLSSLSVVNGASITNGLQVIGNASVSGETDLGGASYNGYFALSAFGLNGGNTVAEFLTSTNDFDSLIRFGDTNYNHLMYFGVVKDPGYDSFEMLGSNALTNNPIVVFNSNQNGGNGYVGIGTNVPSQALTVAGNILATGTNYATQFVGSGTGLSNVTAATNATITLTGDATGSGTTAIAVTVTNASHLTGALPGALFSPGTQTGYGYNYWVVFGSPADQVSTPISINNNYMYNVGSWAGFPGYLVPASTNANTGGWPLPPTMFINKTTLVTKETLLATNSGFITQSMSYYQVMTGNGILNPVGSYSPNETVTLTNGINLYTQWFTNSIVNTNNMVSCWVWPQGTNANPFYILEVECWTY
jgi:hypothetical protein